MKNNDKLSKFEISDKIKKTSKPIKSGYDRVERFIVKVFSFFSNWFDRIIFNQKYSKLVAVCLALLMVTSVASQSDEELFNKNLQSAIKIKDIPVVTNINSNIYDVTGLPAHVSAIITGDTNEVQGVSMNKSELKVSADLTSLDEGDHLIKLTPVNFSSNVDVEIEPSTVTVHISKKVSKSFDIGYDFVNDNKLDKRYVLSEPKLSKENVIVRASEDTINQISFVKVLIDVNGVKRSFEENAPVVAYNQKGELMNVDIIPKVINVSVDVSSPQKVVPLTIKPTGKMKDDYMIDSYSFDTNDIKLYGNKDNLERISSLPVLVDVDGLDKNTTITTPITLPKGIRSSNFSKVSVNLKLAKAEMKKVDDVPIAVYCKKGFDYKIEGLDKSSVDVVGTKNNLNKMNNKNIKIFVDLSNKDEEGLYDAELIVSTNNPLVRATIDKKKLRVRLIKKEK